MTNNSSAVRNSYRYNGEYKPIDLIAGHFPGTVNIPFSENPDETGNIFSPEKLREKYSGFLKGKPRNLIVHCGSGVIACHIV